MADRHLGGWSWVGALSIHGNCVRPSAGTKAVSYMLGTPTRLLGMIAIIHIYTVMSEISLPCFGVTNDEFGSLYFMKYSSLPKTAFPGTR